MGVFMKIKAIEVKNLFSYDDFKIEFNEGNIAVIVGPNNAGKTNLFRALEFFKEVIYETKKHNYAMIIPSDKIQLNTLKNISSYQNNPEDNSHMIVGIEWTDKEQKIMGNFWRCYLNIDLKYEISEDEIIRQLDEVLNLLEEIQMHNPSELPMILESKADLLNRLIISYYFPKFLSNGKFTWKSEKNQKLYCPIYYAIKEKYELDEKILEKIEDIKKIKHNLKNNGKYESIDSNLDMVIQLFNTTKKMLSKEHLIRLHKNCLIFINLENIKCTSKILNSCIVQLLETIQYKYVPG